MSITPEEFRHHWRFSADSFAATFAEIEDDILASVFVQPEWLNTLVYKYSRSLVLYGARGTGKTACRRELARQCRRRGNEALVLNLTIAERPKVGDR